MTFQTETLGVGDWPANPEKQDTETAERPFLVREFVAADLAVEGRTVDVRLVPFGEVARVADPPRWEPYDEEWMPGVFDHQLTAANRIHANYEHSDSVIDVVGHGLTLRAEQDGYHVFTKIHRDQCKARRRWSSCVTEPCQCVAGGACP